MNVWFAIPSARPPAEAEPRLAKWRAMGYKLAIFRDHPQDVACDLELRGTYPGYYAAINLLAAEILKRDPAAEWIVSGGDDMEPDPQKTAAEIAAECCQFFGGALGVMQPTGDRWGHGAHVYAENVAGSPWMGRAWCERAYQGKGPLSTDYRHYYGDEELQNVAQMLGLFWQRQDLSQYHGHYQREKGGVPSFHRNATKLFASDGATFKRRKADGFPGHELATMTELDWARRIVGRADFPVILELGAHHGHDTCQIWDAANGRKTVYVAVEADPRNVPLLAGVVGHRGVQVAHYAIAGFDGTATLHLSSGPGATGSSSIRAPKEHFQHFPTTEFKERVEVPAITLDTLAAKYGITGSIDLIWSDLQGAERDMIAGGQQTLKRTLYLLCECDQVEMYAGQVTRDGLLDLLPGWEVVAEWPENANVLLRNTRV